MTEQSTTSRRQPVPRQPTHAYSVAMVAERWGTSDTFVYEQIRCGRLRAFKLGNKLIRVTFEAVAEYEQEQAMPAPEPEAVSGRELTWEQKQAASFQNRLMRGTAMGGRKPQGE